MKSFKDLQIFLQKIVPLLVEKHIIQARAVKACSGISPDFVFYAQKAGFKAFVKRVPGHVKNIVITSDGPIEVDLSYIQFEFCPKYTQENGEEVSNPERRELERLLDKVKKDPFSAIKVTPLNQEEDESRLEVPDFDDWIFPPIPIEDLEKIYRRKNFEENLSIKEFFVEYIEKTPSGYSVKSKKGKNLGGPYKSKKKAEERLKQVEFFKHKK